VDRGAELAKEQQCDVVIGVGGGSTIDTAKGIAILARNPGKAWNYVERTDQEVSRPKEVLPIVAIPTTAGTGSEVTLYSVLNNPDVKEKSTIYNDLIFPRVALVDPQLMVSMPPKLTALTGIDALSHSVESFINIHANSYSKLLARESIRLVARYLPEAVANGENMEARAKMAWASTLGGMAISHVGTTLPHALGQPVSGLVDAPHGGSIASCLAEILQFSFTSNFERFAELAEALDESVKCLPLRERAEKSGELAQRLFRDVDCEVGFGDFGMQEKDIDKATQVAMSAYFIDLGNHPRKVSAEDLKKLYKACL
jgi:alcohol dehydrogenase class IV